MSVEQAEVVEEPADERSKYAGVLRFYNLAKHHEWAVRDVAWGKLPPVPEGKGSPERQARRQDVWRSVIMQQLQADVLACEMAAQLLNAAPDPEARLAVTTTPAGSVWPAASFTVITGCRLGTHTSLSSALAGGWIVSWIVAAGPATSETSPCAAATSAPKITLMFDRVAS